MKQFRYFEVSLKILKIISLWGFYLILKQAQVLKELEFSVNFQVLEGCRSKMKIQDRRLGAARFTAGLCSERANI